jgi:hypothetical protein
MAPTPDSPKGTAKKPRPHKGKPKFEVPAEVAAAPPAAWVYREAAPAKPATAHKPRPQAARPVRPVNGGLEPASLMLVALETMAHSVAASTRLMLAAASLMGAPIEVTRKILGI